MKLSNRRLMAARVKARFVETTPSDLKELAARLRAEWAPYGVVSVGTGYGVEVVGKGETPRWGLYVYADNLDAIRTLVPTQINGYPVRFRGVPRAL